MTLALDIIIIILVSVMIAYSVILNARLKTFRNSHNEMAALIEQLNGTIGKALTSVEILKETALSEEARLKSLIAKSRLLADELEIITESGSNLADRIERGLVPKQNPEIYEETGGENISTDEDEGYEEDNEMLETLKNIR
ncbi:MAG: hypothetical protein GXP02_09485 [Alphaproteobacteria bacterium]|nr:hypothetical protein [Alphaproteobacteria bacterium]